QRALELLAAPMPCRGGGVEQARRSATASEVAARGAPDAVPHVRIRRVMNPGPAQIAEEVLVVFDLLVAAGEVERDLLHVMDFGVADVPHFQAGRFHLILEPDE